MKNEKLKQRYLLMTMTNEPFQPVRLYYTMASRSFAFRRLSRLDCVVEEPRERCWQWLFDGEAKSLGLTVGYDSIPLEKRPIILGRIRLPKRGGMTLQTNSVQRAIEAAKLFAPVLGSDVVLTRCRVINRYFAAEEGSVEKLMNMLDQNVVVIDPAKAEAQLERDLKDLPPRLDPETIAIELHKKRLQRRQDVPMIEDFPLAPEEETPEFHHLANTLHFRAIRAFEHWKGNTTVTLTDVITRTVRGGYQ